MTDLPATTDQPEDAYALLSRPTLSITDAQLTLIVEELRKKRHLYVQDSKKGADRPKALAAPKAPPSKATQEQKQRNAAVLLSQLNLSNLKLK